MANDQGRRHSRKRRKVKFKTNCNNQPLTSEMRFADADDYVWEHHDIVRLPFREPEVVEIVFHSDKLWKHDIDDSESETSDSETESIKLEAPFPVTTCYKFIVQCTWNLW